MSEEPLSVDSMEASAVTRLLRMGLSPPRRPVDALIARLRAKDGAMWVDRQVEVDLPEEERRILGRVLSGQAHPDDLTRLKELAKTRLSQVRTEPERVSALLAYFLAIAGALAQYGIVITSHAGPDLESALLDLAEAAPRTIQDVIAEASLRAAFPRGR